MECTAKELDSAPKNSKDFTPIECCFKFNV